jgi:hypothetical protein
MKELKKKLTEKLIKKVFNHSELIDEIITDFKESEEFKQLILSGVGNCADDKLTQCMIGRDAECNHQKCPITEKDMENGKYCTLPLIDYRQ